MSTRNTKNQRGRVITQGRGRGRGRGPGRGVEVARGRYGRRKEFQHMTILPKSIREEMLNFLSAPKVSFKNLRDLIDRPSDPQERRNRKCYLLSLIMSGTRDGYIHFNMGFSQPTVMAKNLFSQIIDVVVKFDPDKRHDTVDFYRDIGRISEFQKNWHISRQFFKGGKLLPQFANELNEKATANGKVFAFSEPDTSKFFHRCFSGKYVYPTRMECSFFRFTTRLHVMDIVLRPPNSKKLLLLWNHKLFNDNFDENCDENCDEKAEEKVE